MAAIQWGHPCSSPEAARWRFPHGSVFHQPRAGLADAVRFANQPVAPPALEGTDVDLVQFCLKELEWAVRTKFLALASGGEASAKALQEPPRCTEPLLDYWNSSAPKNAAQKVGAVAAPEGQRRGPSTCQPRLAEQQKPIDSGLGLAQPGQLRLTVGTSSGSCIPQQSTIA